MPIGSLRQTAPHFTLYAYNLVHWLRVPLMFLPSHLAALLIADMNSSITKDARFGVTFTVGTMGKDWSALTITQQRALTAGRYG